MSNSHSGTPSAFVELSPPVPGHIGAALGEMAANRRIRSRIARYSRPGTATSANWNVTYRAWCTIPRLGPILEAVVESLWLSRRPTYRTRQQMLAVPMTVVLTARAGNLSSSTNVHLSTEWTDPFAPI